METWKKFEQNVVSHSAAHHLMAISELLASNGYARVTDVARRLDITRGSASITLKALRERGLVVEDENKFLHLSEQGRELANLIQSKRKILITFFHEILGVPEDAAETDACKIEHLISEETGEKLLAFIKFLMSGEKKADELLKAFNNYQLECGDISSCHLCFDDCFLHDHDQDNVE